MNLLDLKYALHADFSSNSDVESKYFCLSPREILFPTRHNTLRFYTAKFCTLQVKGLWWWTAKIIGTFTSSRDLHILGACHVFNTINDCVLYETPCWIIFHNFFFRLDSWLRSDFLVWELLFKSWRKGVVYLMSALAHSHMQTVLVHSSAEWMRKQGRGRGNKEVMDKKKVGGMLMADVTCNFFFSLFLFILMKSHLFVSFFYKVFMDIHPFGSWYFVKSYWWHWWGKW